MARLPEHLMQAPVGRDPLPREVLAGHQRDRILSAAVEVFAAEGYQRATVDQIVSTAKIGVGTFYALFEGKGDCFLAAYDRIVAGSREKLIAAQAGEGTWPERLATVLRALLELIADEPSSARIALVEVETAGSTAFARHQRNLDQVADMLREGREHSAIAAELPASLEFATVGGLCWFLQQRLVAGDPADATALLPAVLEIVAEPYLGAAATGELAAHG